MIAIRAQPAYEKNKARALPTLFARDPMTVLGVDIGLTGAIAVLTEGFDKSSAGRLIAIHDIPSITPQPAADE